MSFERCRSCMGNCNECQALFSLTKQIMETSYAKLLANVTGVSIELGDGLPDSMCLPCTDRLLAAFDFIQTCKDSDRALRQKRAADPINVNEDSLDFEDDNVEMSIDKSHECQQCHQSFEAISLLNKHIKNVHVDRASRIKYPCEICGKEFYRKSDLIVHGRIHTGEKPYACEYCPMKFTQSGGLIEHRKIHTGETPHICPICSKVFTNRSSFFRHKRVHTKERPYSCNVCGKAFSHSSTLKQHTFVHTDERPHICSLCSKSMKSKYAMRQHMKMHKEKGFVCEQCGKKFQMKAHLKYHIKKMHSDISGHCSHCGKDTSDLKEHMLIHSKNPHYCCHFCGQKYKQKSNLTYHIGLHMNAEKYKCSLDGCKQAFPKRSMLDFHLHKHHYNEYPLFCQFCSKGYFRTCDLSRHLNTNHSEENKMNNNTS